MSDHTPGPWSVDVNKWNAGADDVPYIEVLSGDMVSMAFVQVDFAVDAGWQITSETKANAYLIAAAPELLEQLQSMVRQIEQNGARIGTAGAWLAIKKATGNE